MIGALDEHFSPPRELLDWADSAIQDLEAEIKVFFSPDAGGFVEEIDYKRRCKILKFVFYKKIPTNLRRKGTEALNNIRHSFDQSLFAACRAIGKSRKGILFPWRTTPTDLQRFLETKDVPQEFWDDIKRHEPYFTSNGHAGGDDYIRAMAQLANGKHTVGLGVTGHVIEMDWPNVIGRGTVELISPRWDMKKNEIIYARVPIDAHLQNNERIMLEIVFAETGHLRGRNFKSGLRDFLKMGNSVHEDLKRTCQTVIAS